jgi:ADP-ribose pyrophosphatase
MHKWKRKKSELVLDTEFFKVRKDFVELPDGRNLDWIYWDSTDSAMVVGMTKDKQLVMIRQYRYLVGDEVIEFPSGGLHDGESIEQGARREFKEESGYQCGASLVKLGSFYETYGKLNRKIHIFFAPDISQSQQNLDSTEDIKVELVDFDEAVNLALENKIVAMGSALAVLLLKQKLET